MGLRAWGHLGSGPRCGIGSLGHKSTDTKSLPDALNLYKKLHVALKGSMPMSRNVIIDNLTTFGNGGKFFSHDKEQKSLPLEARDQMICCAPAFKAFKNMTFSTSSASPC